jgi:hypothetical protein
MEEGRIEKSETCVQFESELEAYLEGEARPFVTAHTQDCPFCRLLLSDLEQIRQVVRELPLAEPSPVVWANLHARLEAEGAFRSQGGGWRNSLVWRFLPHPIPVGVLGGLIILASVLTVPPRGLERWDAPDKSTISPATTTAAVMPAGEDSAVAQVVGQLEENFRANEVSLSPDLKATYEKGLGSLDDSIRECLESLHHEPRNTLARDYLLTAYSRKAEILSSALESEGR